MSKIKFEIGDRVKIVGKSESFNKGRSDMAPYLGKIYTIAKFAICDSIEFVEDNILVEPSKRKLGGWRWCPSDIEFVEISIPIGYEFAPSSIRISPKQLKDKTVIVVKGEVYRKIPVIKMTLAEVEKALGKKIEIVESIKVAPVKLTLRVGAFVTLKSKDQITKLNDRNLKYWPGLATNMEQYCGKTCIVSKIYEGGCVKLSGQQNISTWSFCKEMFVGF